MVKPASQRSPAQPATLLGWISTLADETRLRLLHLLHRHELGVVDLCDILQLPQSTVSRHLKVLADQRWIRSRRVATTHLYRATLDELDPAARKLWLLAREQTENWSAVHQDSLRLTRRLRHRSEQSLQFFASAASKWDKLRREIYGERFIHSALLTLLPPDYIVADLGCGTGYLAAELAPRFKQVIAVDNSPSMLKAARKRTQNLPNIDLRRGDLESLPIESAACDAAMLVLVLSYVPDPEKVIQEMSRILKPAARAVIVDLLPHDRDDFRRQMEQQHLGFSEPDLRQMLHDAGFINITIDPLPPESTAPALFLATATRT